jgi:hypothetical protein
MYLSLCIIPDSSKGPSVLELYPTLWFSSQGQNLLAPELRLHKDAGHFFFLTL